MNITELGDGYITYVGLCKDILDELAKELNFQ
jgi:hypothetical protein